MEDFVSILERDYGLKPQGKLAPMSNLKQTPLFPPVAKSATVGNSRYAKDNRSSAPVLAEDDTFSSGAGIKSSSSGRRNTPSGFDPPSSGTIFDDAFTAATSNGVPSVKAGSPLTAFDAPLYDDDIFGGMPGIRGANSAFEDVFNMGSTAAAPSTTGPACHDDLMGGSGIDNKKTTIFYEKASAGDSAVDDLLPGFDPAEPLKPPLSDARELSQHNNSTLVDAFSSNIHENPFTVFNSDDKAHPDYLASSFHVGHPEAKGTKSDKPFNSVEGTQTSTTSLNFENDPSHQRKDLNIAIEAFQQPKNSKSGFFQAPSSGASEVGDCNDMAHPVGIARDDVIARDHKQDTIIQTSAEFVTAGSASQSMKSVQSGNAHNSFKSRVVFQGSADSYSGEREESHMPKVGKSGRMDEYWLTMNDIKLVTQRSTAPPPGRPPPVPVSRQGHEQQKSFPKKMSIKGAAHLSTGTSVEGGMNARKLTRDDLDSFVSGNLRKMDADVHEFKFGVSSPGNEEQGSAAATASGVAMWQAIKMAEAKLRQAKEAKDKDKAEVQGLRVKEEDCAHDNDQSEGESVNNKDMREKQRRERNLRHMQTEKKSGERELEAKKDKANEIARQSDSVERVDGEVQEREFSRAAERTSEARRNADEKATAEAQERHELAAEEKLRSERITTADREKSEKDRMADLREQQTISRQHLESFFMPNSRPTSAPKQRTKATDGIPSNQGLWRSTHSSSTFKKVQSVPSMAEDLTSLFGGPLSGSDTFQEVDGESADRRKFRWDRYQSTLERAAKALEEKHQRDLQIAKDQEERHRASELLDSEIKRWAAGKEGNLRALLSTLHYVLWPECGWQPVSLTELITPAAVKKVYKKATLYVHPDKMQQKRATNQQKYIAEKVFDLLMEAWKKFNSQELF